MAVGYNPRAITDGLVLALDAGNPKNYNAGISTNWTDKVGGNNGTLVGGTYHNDGPFVGAGYVEFDGSGDYLSIADSADFAFGTGDFTVEFWFTASQSAATNTQICGQRDSNGFNNSDLPFFIAKPGSGPELRFGYYPGSGTSLTFATGTASAFNDVWHHVAMVRNGTDFRLYVDGVSDASLTLTSGFSFSNSTKQFSIGRLGEYDGQYFAGSISNFRIVKGTALYTAAFTPPTKPLTAITNTSLLTCQGNTIADASSSAHTITANGDISLTKEPFAGAGAVQFDGSGDYLTAGSASDWTFLNDGSTFTAECWFYSQSTSQQTLLNTASTQSAVGFTVNLSDTSTGDIAVAIYKGTSGALKATSTGTLWNTNTWNHVAVVYSSSTLTIYLNGVSVATADGSSFAFNGSNPSFTLAIGRYQLATPGGYFNGYISNVRLVNGTALYTSNFTPPSRTLEPIENTVLLTCQGQNIKDASSSAHAITVNGDAKATIVSSAFEFDGTDDYILLDSGLGIGTDDFAISVWVKFDSVSGVSGSANYRTVLSSYSGGLGYIFGLWISGNPVFEHYMDGTSYKGNTTIVAGTWYNMVSTRLSGDLYLYLNGSLDNTPVSASTKDMADTATPRIGWIPSASQNGRLDGTVSDLKIYKGKGLTAAEVTQNYNATKGRYA